MKNILSETLEKNKRKYIEHLVKLIQCDTQDLGHGIEGGLEKNGQSYLETVFHTMGAEKVVQDPLTEDVILQCRHQYHEGNLNHN